MFILGKKSWATGTASVTKATDKITAIGFPKEYELVLKAVVTGTNEVDDALLADAKTTILLDGKETEVSFLDGLVAMAMLEVEWDSKREEYDFYQRRVSLRQGLPIDGAHHNPSKAFGPAASPLYWLTKRPQKTEDAAMFDSTETLSELVGEELGKKLASLGAGFWNLVVSETGVRALRFSPESEEDIKEGQEVLAERAATAADGAWDWLGKKKKKPAPRDSERTRGRRTFHGRDYDRYM